MAFKKSTSEPVAVVAVRGIHIKHWLARKSPTLRYAKRLASIPLKDSLERSSIGSFQSDSAAEIIGCSMFFRQRHSQIQELWGELEARSE